MKRIIAGMVLSIVILTGCGIFPSAFQKGAEKEPMVFTAALWNVQALFDGTEAGNEYGEYREKAGWTVEKYAARITAINRAILQMANQSKAQPGTSAGSKQKASPPALIGLVELENAKILEDLAGGELSKLGFLWTAFAAIPGAPLGIGVLSRFPLSDIRAHSITAASSSKSRETAPRPVLEVRVEPGGKPGDKPLVFLLCHWKSKLGNDTEAQRRYSARVVQRRLRELRETEAETPVIVMGDLNENHDEYYRQGGKVFCALLPDDPEAASLAEQGSLSDFLVLSGEKPPRALSFAADVPALYTPWGTEMTDGSYYYRDKWETIDHFLLSDTLFNGSGWNYAGCQVLNQAPFVSSRGSPDSYNPSSGRGLSDHLPLLLLLTDAGASD